MTNYLAMKDLLIDSLTNLNTRVSLTSDIQTASVGSMSFIAVTAHYIDND